MEKIVKDYAVVYTKSLLVANAQNVEELKRFKDLMLSSVSANMLVDANALRIAIDDAIEELTIIEEVDYQTLFDIIIGNRELTNRLLDKFIYEFDEFVSFEWDNIVDDNEILYNLITKNYNLIDLLNGDINEDDLRNDLRDELKHSDHDMQAFIRTLKKMEIVDSLEIRSEVLEARQ